MFANHETSERGLLDRLLGRSHDDVTMDERLIWAHAIDGAIRDAASGSIPFRGRVARPTVVLAAASALVAVAAALRDEDVIVSRDQLAAVRTFMTDGTASPLFGADPLAARRSADLLRARVTGRVASRRAEALGAA
jgi:hypothetical protein